MISLFQQSDGIINPIIVLDNHFGEKIDGLFIANNRWLISVSIDGTVCVSDIIDEDIDRKFQALKRRRARVPIIQKRRFERTMKTIDKQRTKGRRLSI
jgi:hypothetical protein